MSSSNPTGDPRPLSVPSYLRSHKQLLSDDWEHAIAAEHSQLASLERAALLDHLPEVLDALASWVEDERDDAEVLFSALADGHALQRLGYGVDLATLNGEYRLLRRVIMTRLLEVPSSAELREDLIRLDEGLDHAIFLAVSRYAQGRDQLRDRFIGILGHDLRNPLASVSFALQALASTATSGLDRKAVETATRALARMSRMVDDVLDFARAHVGGGIPTTLVEADMAEICQSAVREVQSAHPRRRIQLETSGDLSGTFDRDRVLQTLVNLLSNAVQHGDDPIAVSATEADDRRAVFTRVVNHGKSIPAHIVNKLFDPFTSAAEHGTRGLGLGLYIVGQIVRAHGGTCEVASGPSETAFTVRWPRTPRSETPARP